MSSCDMNPSKVFMMGEFEAKFPIALSYAKNHMWASATEGASYRLGLSAYAVRLLQDVYFLDLTIEIGMSLVPKQEIGAIESKKAESSLYSPMGGRVTNVNEDLLNDPSAINVDKYGSGWLFEIQSTGEDLLDVDGYLAHLESAWDVAQRTIKGQVNS